MTAEQLYLTISTVIFAFLCTIWSTNNFPNVMLKLTFLGLGFYGAMLLGYSLGFIVKA